VKRLAETDGLTLVLVEQNTRLALAAAPRTIVMDRGRIVYDGTSETLRGNPDMLERMIGVSKRPGM
jgi:branched-chain amino acid transport system ATP-binding protein